jgi:ABC-type dipeptide/oligopeptide/nickel transport system permease component
MSRLANLSREETLEWMKQSYILTRYAAGLTVGIMSVRDSMMDEVLSQMSKYALLIGHNISPKDIFEDAIGVKDFSRILSKDTIDKIREMSDLNESVADAIARIVRQEYGE